MKMNDNIIERLTRAAAEADGQVWEGLSCKHIYANMAGAVMGELIEMAKADFLDAQKRREEMSGTSLSLRVDRAKATYEWLKSQMESE